MSHYKPISQQWSDKDVQKYRQWYFSWLNYIEKKCPVFKKKLRIFEIGSGVGSMASLLHERGHEVTGSDISDLMVKSAALHCKPIRFVLCDIQKKIPSSTKFNVVMGFEVLEHVPNLTAALKSIYQGLDINGYFIGTTPYPYKKNFIDPTHVNVHFPSEWEGMFRKAGFREVHVYPMSFFPLIWRIHKLFNPVLPFYTPLPLFISTTLIVAKK